MAQSGAAAPADIPAAPLTDAIKQVAERYGVSVGAGGALPAIVTRPVAKPRNVADALKRMLAGTGWVAHRIGPGSWRIEATVRSVVRPVAPPVRLAAPVVPAAIGESDILVTAAKTSTRLSTIPRSISVVRFGADDQASPSNATALIARGSDGLVMTELGAGSNRIFLRGIADSPLNGSGQSPVAVLIDGGRLTYSAPDPDLRLVDVDRVELLKGPQGSLYGTGVLGGIYEVVARQARLDRIEAMVSPAARSVCGARRHPPVRG